MRTPRVLRIGLLLAACVAAVPTARQAGAVPFRPDVLASLRAEGRLPEVVASIRDAQQRGLDRPFGRSSPAGPDGLRQLHHRQAIVLLVDFVDQPADPQLYPPGHYDSLLFSVGTYPTGSMRDWYLENSYGRCDVTGMVTIWLRMPQSYAYYVDGQAGFGDYPRNAQKLAEDAVVAADPLVDFSQFDNDGPDGQPNSGDDDGSVDALFVVHAGLGREESGSNDDIHSHAWSLRSPQEVDGVVASGYSMEPENGKRGVFGHEFGHVLGLPDLYDTDYSSSGVGVWCMMSFGSWGAGGLTPTHFLSWCKARLGFMEPTTPLVNAPASSIPQVETTPVAYKLWTGGYPAGQFFTVENRQQVGSDASLPGAGLILCHVDETVPDNTNESHPLVSIEQADGLEELQAGGDSDAGDPFPGSTDNRTFDESSDPDSRDYGGFATQVAVRNIGNSGPEMTADLEVETRPILVEAWHGFVEITGNGDGDLDPGETWQMPFRTHNRGTSATGVNATLVSGDPEVTILSGSMGFGPVPAEGEADGTPPFLLALSGSATADALPFIVAATPMFWPTDSLPVVVGVNDPMDSFRWAHRPIRTGYLDEWHISVRRNHTPGGAYAWKCGAAGAGDYANREDAALQSLPLPLPAVQAVRFHHWIDAEDDANWTAWDGGVIEASVDGGPWQILLPDGGYPYTIIANPASPFPAGTPCFSGTFDWSEVRLDLAGLTGEWIELRFRFGSDGYVTQEGWYLDDFVVEGTSPTAVEGRAAPGGVQLAPPRPNPASGLVVLSGSLPPGASGVLSVLDLAGREVWSRALLPGTAAWRSIAWEGRDRDGRPLPSGVYWVRWSRADGRDGTSRRLLLVR